MKKIFTAFAFFLCSTYSAEVCHALTPQQVIDLKSAGVSEETIRIMIRQEAGQDPYAALGAREMKDKDGNTVIIYTTGGNGSSGAGDEKNEDLDKAWKMLNNIIIDKRNKK